MSRKYRRRKTSGQAMVEMALTIPFLLVALFGIIYFGRYFYTSQVVTYAAQEGARVASRVPNLQDADTRNSVKGFTTDGTAVNSSSVVYAALSGARMLSSGTTGNLPNGARIKLLPWDGDGGVEDQIPQGTVALRIEYPFKLFADSPSASGNLELGLGADPIVNLGDFVISERATAAQEIYQETN